MLNNFEVLLFAVAWGMYLVVQQAQQQCRGTEGQRGQNKIRARARWQEGLLSGAVEKRRRQLCACLPFSF